MKKNRYLQIIDHLSKTTSLDSVQTTCNNFCSEFGFEGFAYGGVYPKSLSDPTVVIYSSYPKEWVDRYAVQNYISIDPTIAHCAKNITHLLWDAVKPLEKENKKIKLFMSESRDFGLTSGMSIPVHGAQGDFSNLSFSSRYLAKKSRKDFVHSLPFISLIGPHIHESIRRIENMDNNSLSVIELNERERQCLLWAAEGKTSWETSVILNISERTVVFHLQNASTKLKSTNRIHTVARAISLRLIAPIL